MVLRKLEYLGDAPSRAGPARFWLPAIRIIDRLDGMGAKYLPTNKDLKASRRFLQKQHVQSKFIKSPVSKPARKSKQT